jgi:hypothetical protein
MEAFAPQEMESQQKGGKEGEDEGQTNDRLLIKVACRTIIGFSSTTVFSCHTIQSD